jgi:RNA polymerase sigma-70 factor, ECF subfamily
MDPNTNGHDQSLVALISRGDRATLARVYADLKDDLLSASYHLLGDRAAAEDVLQDVFLSLAGSAKKIRLTGRLKGYLLVSCLNRARDLLRRRRIEPTAVETLDEKGASTDGPADIAEKLDEAARVAGALAGIPEEQREVVVLKVYGQLTFREIGEALEVSINTVQSRYRYALAALRKRLEPEGAER